MPPLTQLTTPSLKCFVQGVVLERFMSCVSCRFQHVVLRLSITSLLCGVSQGSVLGPPLFWLYIRQLADLTQKHSSDYHLFAADSEFHSCPPIERDSILQAICNVQVMTELDRSVGGMSFPLTRLQSVKRAYYFSRAMKLLAVRSSV